MTYAIHNYHVPAIEVDEAGTATHDGTTRLMLSAPLYAAETREEAEAWRLAGWRPSIEEVACLTL